MKTLFCSGSCRLLTTINNGRDKVLPLHSMYYNFVGTNFLGKLHDTKQHLQFINFILGNIQIPDNILSSFLTLYNPTFVTVDKDLNEISRENIKKDFFNCDMYIFEICSIKLYNRDQYQVQVEHTENYTITEQSEEDLYQDLQKIRDIIPKEKPILFVCHFRPNIINCNEDKAIHNREVIYHILNKFVATTENCQLCDPSLFLRDNSHCYDRETHFTPDGHKVYFDYLFENFLKK